MALTSLGLLLAAYVMASYSWTAWRQHRLVQEWQTAPATHSLPPVPARGAVARLLVPKIDLDAVVVEGTTPQALRLGPGHLAGTALPGMAGNSVIAAHRDTFFRRLGEMMPGDSIYVEGREGLREYTVTATRVVQPNDVTVLRTSANPHLTLITCYPIRYLGPAPRRFVVTARLKGGGLR
jgi:sortase A